MILVRFQVLAVDSPRYRLASFSRKLVIERRGACHQANHLWRKRYTHQPETLGPQGHAGSTPARWTRVTNRSVSELAGSPTNK